MIDPKAEDGWVKEATVLGQGLCSLTEIEWVDGSDPLDPDAWMYDDDFPAPDDPILCYASIRFDTGYSFQPSASGLHRDLTRELGDWLDVHGLDWVAQNEPTGEWGKCPMPFIRDGKEAEAFGSMVIDMFRTGVLMDNAGYDGTGKT